MTPIQEILHNAQRIICLEMMTFVWKGGTTINVYTPQTFNLFDCISMEDQPSGSHDEVIAVVDDRINTYVDSLPRERS